METETELTAGFAEKENPAANRSQTDKLPVLEYANRRLRG